MMPDIELPAALHIARYHFTLELLGELLLPFYKGSVLRGGFGWAFRRTVCYQPDKPTCEACLLQGSCPYVYIFDTQPHDNAVVLSRNSDVPLPFIIEPPLDPRRQYKRGERLGFDLVLIGRGIDHLAYFLVAFQRLGELGLTRRRVPYRLARVTTPTPHGDVVVFDGDGTMLGTGGGVVGAADLVSRAKDLPTKCLTIDFLTPTQLKHDGRFHRRPDFHVLIRALLRRTSSLAYFHCGERWETGYRGWIERAETVRTVEARTGQVDVWRYSRRQGQRVSLGGPVGQMVYEGDLEPFRPLLALGEWIHVGKASVFGNGMIRVRPDQE